MSIIRKVVVSGVQEFLATLNHLGWFNVVGMAFVTFRNVKPEDKADKKDSRMVVAQHKSELLFICVTVKDEDFKLISAWAQEQKTILVETTSLTIFQNKDAEL